MAADTCRQIQPTCRRVIVLGCLLCVLLLQPAVSYALDCPMLPAPSDTGMQQASLMSDHSAHLASDSGHDAMVSQSATTVMTIAEGAAIHECCDAQQDCPLMASAAAAAVNSQPILVVIDAALSAPNTTLSVFSSIASPGLYGPPILA